MNLEDEFEARVQESIAQSRSHHRDPAGFVSMLHRWGAVEAARRLVINGTIQDGLVKIVRMKLPELAIESIMLEPQFASLFSEEELKAASWRREQILKQANR